MRLFFFLIGGQGLKGFDSPGSRIVVYEPERLETY